MLPRTTGYTQIEIQAPQPATPKVKPKSDSVAALFETSLAESQKDFKLPYAESPPFARYALEQKGLPLELRNQVMEYVNQDHRARYLPMPDLRVGIDTMMQMQTAYQEKERLVKQAKDINKTYPSVMDLMR